MKARMKSDEELGLRRAASDRMSMPVERSITSRRLRHQLSLSEHSPRSNTVQDGKQSCADQAAAKDTITPKAPTDRSLKSVHSDSDVKQGNLSPSSYNPPSMSSFSHRKSL
ncbi:unnamed protein product [Toxocara canis]|uniref:DUF4005 domain-containing protein n=1 Tax=Toxocara canis TaxID=6265 RepID=A0A183U7H7_TOXCA|nr:unnamed protein product [Toxocara canis]